MEAERDLTSKPRTEDLAIFLSLSIPIFAVSAALLAFIVLNAVIRGH